MKKNYVTVKIIHKSHTSAIRQPKRKAVARSILDQGSDTHPWAESLRFSPACGGQGWSVTLQGCMCPCHGDRQEPPAKAPILSSTTRMKRREHWIKNRELQSLTQHHSVRDSDHSEILGLPSSGDNIYQCFSALLKLWPFNTAHTVVTPSREIIFTATSWL